MCLGGSSWLDNAASRVSLEFVWSLGIIASLGGLLGDRRGGWFWSSCLGSVQVDVKAYGCLLKSHGTDDCFRGVSSDGLIFFVSYRGSGQSSGIGFRISCISFFKVYTQRYKWIFIYFICQM